MPRIKVHEKALAHLSRGLYRSPASALRELVSNAWDANATTVHIDTNYPNFLRISISDNGVGFTKTEFERLMGGGVGNSLKRPRHLSLEYNRPVIGRLGIGLLGIAQICGSFVLTSKTKDGNGFRARVKLYDLLKEKLDVDDAHVVKIGSADKIIEIDVGEYNFEDFDPAKYSIGTLLIADDVHPTFTRSFIESTSYKGFKSPPLEWNGAMDIIGKVHSLQELGDYWKLLWELAASCPIRYIDSKAIPKGLIAEEEKRLESYQFDVIVDGISLRKPTYLKGNPGGYSTWPIKSQRKLVYGRPMSFHGYLVVQEGNQLKPDELRGILIRIKNVAIGYYDPSLLDYRFNEGPRAKWITGEIYVDEGLEDALNIDRDSFNRFHPEFREIQRFVHDLLHNSVFPESYKQIDVRSKAKSQKRESARAEHLTSVISSQVSKPVEMAKQSAATKEAATRVQITREKGGALAISFPEQVKTKKASQPLAKAILAVFEVALREKTDEAKRDVFTKLVLDLLNKW